MAFGWIVLVSALLSAALTATVSYVLWRRVFLPELERRVEERLARAREDLGQVIERSARKGLAEALASSLPTREMLQDTTINVARSGMELLGDSLNSLLGARRGRRLSDRERRAGESGAADADDEAR